MKRTILTTLLLSFLMTATAQSFDIDLSRQEPGKAFRHSVAVPDGNYRVTLTIGSKKMAGETYVRAACSSKA